MNSCFEQKKASIRIVGLGFPKFLFLTGALSWNVLCNAFKRCEGTWNFWEQLKPLSTETLVIGLPDGCHVSQTKKAVAKKNE